MPQDMNAETACSAVLWLALTVFHSCAHPSSGACMSWVPPLRSSSSQPNMHVFKQYAGLVSTSRPLNPDPTSIHPIQTQQLSAVGTPQLWRSSLQELPTGLEEAACQDSSPKDRTPKQLWHWARAQLQKGLHSGGTELVVSASQVQTIDSFPSLDRSALSTCTQGSGSSRDTVVTENTTNVYRATDKRCPGVVTLLCTK